MIVRSEATLERFRQATHCDVCRLIICGRPQPHHISKRGMGCGSRLDASWNILALDWECHRLIEDANPIKHGPHAGKRLRDADQWLIVSHRDGISLNADLQKLAWWFDRLDRDASPARIRKALAELNDDEAFLAVATLLEAKVMAA